MEYADNFRVWGPYTRQDGRKIVVVERNGKRRTVSYPKWIMECELGRELHPDEETVDHKDFNFDNNNVDNLRLVPRDEHSGDDTRRVKNIKLKCDWCGKDFERSPRLLRDKSRKGSTGTFCSRSCAGSYNRAVQLGSQEKFPVQPYTESEYYRRKHVQALSYYFITKYAELSLVHELNALRNEMVLAAQEILDAWQPDEDGYDDEFGSGGACDAIANAFTGIVSKLDVEVADGGQDGDDHAYIVVFTDDEACVVDIPPYVYETGGGYVWKKIPGVVLKPTDILIEKIKRSDLDY